MAYPEKREACNTCDENEQGKSEEEKCPPIDTNWWKIGYRFNHCCFYAGGYRNSNDEISFGSVRGGSFNLTFQAKPLAIMCACGYCDFHMLVTWKCQSTHYSSQSFCRADSSRGIKVIALHNRR